MHINVILTPRLWVKWRIAAQSQIQYGHVAYMNQLAPTYSIARQVQFTKSQKRLQATDAINLM